MIHALADKINDSLNERGEAAAAAAAEALTLIAQDVTDLTIDLSDPEVFWASADEMTAQADRLIARAVTLRGYISALGAFAEATLINHSAENEAAEAKARRAAQPAATPHPVTPQAAAQPTLTTRAELTAAADYAAAQADYADSGSDNEADLMTAANDLTEAYELMTKPYQADYHLPQRVALTPEAAEALSVYRVYRQSPRSPKMTRLALS